MDRPRCLFAVTNDLSYDQRMIRICSSLSSAGFDVTFIGRELPSSVLLESRPYQQKRLRCRFLKGPLFYLEYNLRLLFFLLWRRYDILCACDLDTILAIRLSGMFSKVKRVFDAHEHFTEVPELQEKRWKKRVWHMLGKRCIPGFDLAYTVSPNLADILSTEYGKDFQLILNVPANRDLKVTPIAEREKILLYQGALNEGRGLEKAIEAMQSLKDYTLLIAGEGDLSQDLRHLTDRLGLNRRVLFLGRVKPEDLADITSRAMLGLNLLENKGASYYFSLANKFFDYMHAGVPSVNPPFPEYEAILAEFPCGITADISDASDLASHLYQILSDEPTLQLMTDTCLIARNVYNWNAEQDHLISLYRELAN